MRTDKQKALSLRLKGKSYNEICGILNIPKSTLSGWFTGLALPPAALARLNERVYAGAMRGLLKHNKMQTHLAQKRMRLRRKLSKNEINKLSAENLKFFGIALYWAEGYKRLQKRNGRELTHHPVALSNSDPKLIRVYLKFLRQVCRVTDDHIKAEIRIYEHMNEKNLLKFWQKTTKLPFANFSKIYNGVSKSSLNKRPYNRLPYGTICVRVNNTELFHKIMGWIEGVAGLPN